MSDLVAKAILAVYWLVVGWIVYYVLWKVFG